jgi:diguanylate cyclase (GGDEF)-like protein
MRTVPITHIARRGEHHHCAYPPDWGLLAYFANRPNTLAHYDQLTGLANRLLFTDRLIQAGEHAKRHQRQTGVLFLDLDRFKFINDTLGHPAGDLLLRAVSERLLGCVRRQDTVARLGSDEFTIVLESVHGPQDAASVAQKILHAMTEPFWLAQHEVHVTTSIGIAMLPSDDEDVDDLIRKADTAMYHAKEQGRNNYQFFTAEMNATVSAKLSLENKLRHAMNGQELVVYYQPVVELCTGRITGAEALLRWRDPDTQNLVLPSQFIPLAEETGLIVPLGEWVLRTACQQNKDWQDAGLSPLRVSVNLSARQLRQQGFTATVARILCETWLDSSSLALEITETMLMQNMDAAVAALRELDAMGICLSMDDFGTGYSSLAYLKRLPIDILKIDRSFVRDIGSHDGNGAIPEAIIAMAHSLGLKVVAEGVETTQQLAFLRERRCDAMQGFYVSAPVPAEELQSLLQLNPNPLLPKPA